MSVFLRLSVPLCEGLLSKFEIKEIFPIGFVLLFGLKIFVIQFRIYTYPLAFMRPAFGTVNRDFDTMDIIF